VIIETVLKTPALPRRVPEGVFDAFGWCESDTLVWRRPVGRWDASSPVDGTDPARMVFVMHDELDFLPREKAFLHAYGMGLTDEWALAPYAIDDATDELYARRRRPRDVLWLAADNLNALFWGLHDWAHFHNHGPFEQRAWTELQCDTTALAWIDLTRAESPIDCERDEQLRHEIFSLIRSRFLDEGIAFDETWLYPARP
jgi:hypothetical protein